VRQQLRRLPGVALGSAAVLVSHAYAAGKSYSANDRAEFRELVDDYQLFVVPHCAPDIVAEYDKVNAPRDAAFVRSLKGTPLLSDYRKAVAGRARRDKNTIYECGLYPPPPPGVVLPKVDLETRRSEDRAKHFAEGDKQFARIVALRDKLVAGQRK
jgi:hypothetical protein